MFDLYPDLYRYILQFGARSFAAQASVPIYA